MVSVCQYPSHKIVHARLHRHRLFFRVYMKVFHTFLFQFSQPFFPCPRRNARHIQIDLPLTAIPPHTAAISLDTASLGIRFPNEGYFSSMKYHGTPFLLTNSLPSVKHCFPFSVPVFCYFINNILRLLYHVIFNNTSIFFIFYSAIIRSSEQTVFTRKRIWRSI